MIELIAAAVSGAVVGGGVVWLGWSTEQRLDRKLIAGQRKALDVMRMDHTKQFEMLHALRSNCFIPDERGVKVRYSQASVERRVKAETPKEVV